jgi:hypothetical protein
MDLPIDNEPLVLADGTKIDCTSGKVIKDRPANFVVVPSPSEAQKIVARTRKTVADLPLPPQNLSGVALVAFYTLFGLNDQDISIALDGKLTVEQINNIRSLTPYIEFMQTAKENILNTQQDSIREVYEQHAPVAAGKIVELAQSDNDVLAFKASQDLLDRAGHRPADVVLHKHKMEDSLNIVITRRDENEKVPVIDVTPLENING